MLRNSRCDSREHGTILFGIYNEKQKMKKEGIFLLQLRQVRLSFSIDFVFSLKIANEALDVRKFCRLFSGITGVVQIIEMTEKLPYESNRCE